MGCSFRRSLGAPRKSPGTTCFPVSAPSGHIMEGVHLKPLQSRSCHSKLKIRLQAQMPTAPHLGCTRRVTWKTDGMTKRGPSAQHDVTCTGPQGRRAQRGQQTGPRLRGTRRGVAEAATCRASACMNLGPSGRNGRRISDVCLAGRGQAGPGFRGPPRRLLPEPHDGALYGVGLRAGRSFHTATPEWSHALGGGVGRAPTRTP